MATHIIIPIKELTEDGIKFIESLSGHTAKQISLDEKDIDDNSKIVVECEKLWMENYFEEERKTLTAACALDGMVKGYKQALKDLYGTD